MVRPGPKPQPGREYSGRYRPIVDLLAATAGDAVTLTFAEMEGLIGGALPTSAYTNARYWSGLQGSALPHVRAMSALGWRGRIDFRNQCVRFTRVAAS